MLQIFAVDFKYALIVGQNVGQCADLLPMSLGNTRQPETDKILDDSLRKFYVFS